MVKFELSLTIHWAELPMHLQSHWKHAIHNHIFNFDIAFQSQEQKPQKFKIFQAKNKEWTKFESKKKQTDHK